MKFIIIGCSILTLFLVIYFPSFRTSFNKWKNKIKIERETELITKQELAKLKKEKELAELDKARALATKERNERLKKAKDEEVDKNNSTYKSMFSSKYENARIYHEVQYTGAYRVPIADYWNNDLNIHNDGLSFFIDNLKSAQGKGQLEVRHNSFEDNDFDTYSLEIIDGFAILDKRLKTKNHPYPFQDYFYFTIRENSFEDIKTGIIHNIRFTPYRASDWK